MRPSLPSVSLWTPVPRWLLSGLHANYCNQTQVFLILHLTHLLTAVSWVFLPLQTSLNHAPLATYTNILFYSLYIICLPILASKVHLEIAYWHLWKSLFGLHKGLILQNTWCCEPGPIITITWPHLCRKKIKSMRPCSNIQWKGSCYGSEGLMLFGQV